MKRIRLPFFILAVLSFVVFACEKPEPYQEPKQDPTEEPQTDPDPDPEPDPDPNPEPPHKPKAGDYRLPLIETTDIHGHMLETGSNGTVRYGLASIAYIADDARSDGSQIARDRLLLLDGGDIYQGASVSNLLNGWPLFVAFDKMGYDAVAVGNHEFDWGIENTVDADATMPDYDWQGRHYENKVPVLCANMYKNGSRVSFTRDCEIVKKIAVSPNGDTVSVKIGIVGFAENYATSIMTAKFTGLGYTIDADYSIANRIASELENSHQCDATILLVHGAAQTASEKLGSNTPIDLVLGGHSHTTQNGTSSWGLPYLQGGRYCEHYAKADLWFTVDDDGDLSFSRVSNRYTPSVDYSNNLSQDIVAVSDAAIEATAEQQNDVIGYITTPATTFSIPGSGDRATNMSNWMCDITRRIGDADVAFVNSGGIRKYFTLEGQSRRDITVANVFEMFPFNNEIYVYQLTYAELLSVFEYSLSGGSGLFSRMTGMDCYFSGNTVVKLVKDGTTIYSDGSWTGGWASKNVTMAICSYIATADVTAIPLKEWNESPRLLDNSQIDNVSAVRVLKEDAAKSGGLLYIDTAAHYLEW